MKKIKNIIIIILFLIVLKISSAYFYEIKTKCQNNVCISNKTVEFVVNITNKGTSELEIVSFEIIENTSSKKVAEYNESKVVVQGYGHSNLILLNTTLPVVNKRSVINYYPCITTLGKREHRLYRSRFGLEIEYCYEKNTFNITVHPCSINNECSYDEFCEDYICKKLDCDQCNYILNHKCVSYECCNSNDCASNQICLNNSCELLTCKIDEIPVNHTCIKLECKEDEYVFNSSCIKLKCNQDEYVFNHTCEKLNCKKNEHVMNHSCVILECKGNEHAINQQCKLLNCSSLQYPKNNKCKIDTMILLAIIAKFISWIMIIIIIILIIKKYKTKQIKNNNKQPKNL